MLQTSYNILHSNHDRYGRFHYSISQNHKWWKPFRMTPGCACHLEVCSNNDEWSKCYQPHNKCSISSHCILLGDTAHWNFHHIHYCRCNPINWINFQECHIPKLLELAMKFSPMKELLIKHKLTQIIPRKIYPNSGGLILRKTVLMYVIFLPFSITIQYSLLNTDQCKHSSTCFSK